CAESGQATAHPTRECPSKRSLRSGIWSISLGEPTLLKKAAHAKEAVGGSVGASFFAKDTLSMVGWRHAGNCQDMQRGHAKKVRVNECEGEAGHFFAPM